MATENSLRWELVSGCGLGGGGVEQTIVVEAMAGNFEVF